MGGNISAFHEFGFVDICLLSIKVFELVVSHSGDDVIGYDLLHHHFFESAVAFLEEMFSQLVHVGDGTGNSYWIWTEGFDSLSSNYFGELSKLLQEFWVSLDNVWVEEGWFGLSSHCFGVGGRGFGVWSLGFGVGSRGVCFV